MLKENAVAGGYRRACWSLSEFCLLLIIPKIVIKEVPTLKLVLVERLICISLYLLLLLFFGCWVRDFDRVWHLGV